MGNPSSDSYRNPLRHTGQDYSFAPRYIRPRDPKTPFNASTDIKPKENQGYYPTGTFWTTSTNGNLFALQKITNNLANWILLAGGGSGPLLTLTGDDNVAVQPDVNGNINLQGLVVANGTHSKAVFTESPSVNTEKIDVQVSAAIGATDITKVGLSAFNNTQFTVDANGFVALSGGGAALERVNLQTGTTPIVPSGGAITFNGSLVAAGSNPVRTDGTGPNTMALEVQISQAIASTDITKVGLSAFNSAQFSVDGNGFVSITDSSVSQIKTNSFSTSGTYTPTAGMVYCIVEILAAGGGGGGCPTTDATHSASGGGGGGGGYIRATFTAAQIGASQSFVIGTGGAGGAAGGTNIGVAGGNSTFGAFLSAIGGSGGPGGNNINGSGISAVGAAGGVTFAGDLGITGGSGLSGLVYATTLNAGLVYGLGGNGGASFFGLQNQSVTDSNGAPGNLGGGGGGGSTLASDGTGKAGGSGGNGILVITEFIL